MKIAPNMEHATDEAGPVRHVPTELNRTEQSRTRHITQKTTPNSLRQRRSDHEPPAKVHPCTATRPQDAEGTSSRNQAKVENRESGHAGTNPPRRRALKSEVGVTHSTPHQGHIHVAAHLCACKHSTVAGSCARTPCVSSDAHDMCVWELEIASNIYVMPYLQERDHISRAADGPAMFV